MINFVQHSILQLQVLVHNAALYQKVIYPKYRYGVLIILYNTSNYGCKFKQ